MNHEMMEYSKDTQRCGGCPRNCPLAAPQCPKGEALARDEALAPREQPQTLEGRLTECFRSLGHRMRFMSGGRAGQGRLLHLLERESPITQRRLMDRVGVRAGSLSEVLGKMEANGWIERAPSPKDRRSVEITLTPAGRAAAQNRPEEEGGRFDCLTEEEKRTLLGLLEKLSADWRARYPGMEDMHGHGPHGHHGPHGLCEFEGRRGRRGRDGFEERHGPRGWDR